MSARIMKNWQAVSEALGITAQTCTVYRAPPRKHTENKRRFTKDAAIRDAVKAIANKLSPCECSPGDEVTPTDYCGCNERHGEMVEMLTGIAKRLPESAEEWAQITADDYWDDYKWKEET